MEVMGMIREACPRGSDKYLLAAIISAISDNVENPVPFVSIRKLTDMKM